MSTMTSDGNVPIPVIFQERVARAMLIDHVLKSAHDAEVLGIDPEIADVMAKISKLCEELLNRYQEKYRDLEGFGWTT